MRVCVTCRRLLRPAQRLCWRLWVSRFLALLCTDSTSQCDVQGNGLRTAELFHSASISAAASSVSLRRGAVAKRFVSFTADRWSSSSGAFRNISLGGLSTFAVITCSSTFIAAPAAVSLLRLVCYQRAAPEDQVRVGALHLHNGLVCVWIVAASRFGLRLHCRPGVHVFRYLQEKNGAQLSTGGSWLGLLSRFCSLVFHWRWLRYVVTLGKECVSLC